MKEEEEYVEETIDLNMVVLTDDYGADEGSPRLKKPRLDELTGFREELKAIIRDELYEIVKGAKEKAL